jgi:hypothetical protein
VEADAEAMAEPNVVEFGVEVDVGEEAKLEQK